jgi:deoxyribonuclease-4
MIIGSHVQNKAPLFILGSVKEMLDNNADALMLYFGPPQNSVRKNINSLLIKEAHQLLLENKISSKNIVVHSPYIINLASLDKAEFGISYLTNEIASCSYLGAINLIYHPGFYKDSNVEDATKILANSLNEVIANTLDSNVVINLETMAGKGSELGFNFNNIKNIIDPIEHKERIGVCLDTCHIWDSGYDIVNHYEEVIKEFDQIIGLSYLKVIHLNDSLNPLGAHKDRHANIGYGHIGFPTLLKVVNDPRFQNIPIILETPYSQDDKPYHKIEIELLKNGVFKEFK